ncbi:ATP-dependent bile acid permease, partial [Lachnellula willkommii]
MFHHQSESLVSGVVGTALIFLLTSPSVFAIISHLRAPKANAEIYKDKDGAATPESMAKYSAKIPKILLVVLVVLGFLTSTALAVLATLGHRSPTVVEDWLNAAQWFLILVQTTGVLTIRDTIKAYALGIHTAISCILLLAVLLVQDQLIAQASGFEGPTEITTLRIAQLFIVIFTGFAGVSIPRRPDVFYGVRAQLSALIFQKAMRRKDVKGASKSSQKASGEGPDISNAMEDPVADKPEVDEEEGDPKGKQSTVNLIGVDTKRISDFCSFNNYFPGTLAATSLAVYAFLYGDLTPSVAFTAIGVFNNLEVTLAVIPELTTNLIDAWVSSTRIEKYLSAPEITKNTNDAPNISFENASIAWPSDEDKEDGDERYVLRNVNIAFPENELSEVDVLEGKINVPSPPNTLSRHDHLATPANWIIPSAIAFVAQIPWIENASIKDNILFGLPFDQYRYKKVLEVCALKKDLHMLTDGESTEIGANGINLSGGQRWRVTFARAMYSRAGILVLDDIFSAVDAHVGRFIFEKGLTGELGVGRTRILVTHHVALCKSKTKYIVELGDGTIEHAGLVQELENEGTLQEIISHEESAQQIQEDEESIESTAVNSAEESSDENEPLKKVDSKTPRKFVEEEAREEGRVKTAVYLAYMKASGGIPFWSVAVLAYAIMQALLTALRYLPGAREVKRLESNAKSPVFEQFGSALTGVGTIRAFDKTSTYITRMFSKIDDHSTSFWHLWAFNRWMGFRMALVGGFFATFVAIFILYMKDIDASLAGFALSFALEYTSTVVWTIRHYANLELDMNAAERIIEYSNLATESQNGADPPAHWPSEGRLEVNDLVVSYADDLPPVLKGLTFRVERNEPIIPQDPVLFSGTVRTNLDAFDQHSDVELRDALVRVHLITEAEALSSGTNTPIPLTPTSHKNKNLFANLNTPITEGGLNLSQGQRQLLCLARAIVSRPKIMVLDEATSAVDMETDALIQRSIREEFGDSTLVVIAHRLSTIVDFDKILVLGEGRVE